MFCCFVLKSCVIDSCLILLRMTKKYGVSTVKVVQGVTNESGFFFLSGHIIFSVFCEMCLIKYANLEHIHFFRIVDNILSELCTLCSVASF
jgi:hypothetical protein